ncbi:MAG: DUF6273 domain-containing protein [Treponema sp.]|nr:DUF6273 domain-containing protein [Treponema sp.]
MNKKYGKITALFISLLLLIGFTACNNAVTSIVPLVSTETSGNDETSGNGETSETPTESKTLSSISVSGTPSKTVYLSGESFDSSGITVTATYSDESTETVTTYTNDLGTDICYNGKTLTLSYTYNSVTKTASLTGPFYIAASDALTQTVIANGTKTITVSENGANVERTYDLVKFGDFPQTIAASGITYSSSTVYNGWYLGSDGYFYEECSANPYQSSYTFSNNVTIASGTTYYFKVQPIVWRVLTSDYNSTGKKLLLVEKILTANVPYYGSTTNRTLTVNGVETTIYANNYKYSNIRAYLNGTKKQYVTDGGTSNDYTIDWSDKGFLQKAFTTSAQALIPTTSVDNSAASTNPDGNSTLWNSGTNDYACDNTSDKIFLLSEQEVTTSSYGFAAYDEEDSNRIRQATDYANANTSGAGQNTGYWWLRSPYYDDCAVVRYTDLYGPASYQCSVYDRESGVCPALCISFE